jgi:S-DNA-T family DNA segregation ATPase FtsK/SpoIIIE
MDLVGYWSLRFHDHAQICGEWALDNWQGLQARRQRAHSVLEENLKQETRAPIRIEPKISEIIASERPEKEKQTILFQEPSGSALPTLALLDTPKPSGAGYSSEALEAMSRLVELKLKDFGIEAAVVAVLPGPVITRFELMPAPGIKASRITGLSKDLARSLSTVSVRVVEVIPGKSVIGLEIPNERREIISLSEVLKAREYEDCESPLTLALGGGRRLGAHAPSVGRRDDWLGEIGRTERHDPELAVQGDCSRSSSDHDRSENARVVGLRRDPQPVGTGGDRHEGGR